MRRARWTRGLVATGFCAVLGLSGCRAGEATVIRLVTSRPEFAGYAELFNEARPEYKLELVYAADPLDALLDRPPPDIVVSDRFSCRESLSRLEGLDDLFRPGGIRRDAFYPGSLETGVADGRQRALPVSFSLPAVVFKTGALSATDGGALLEVTDLQRLAGEFNRVSGGRYTRMGFSPTWDTGFLVAAAVLGPPAYQSTQDCRLTWLDPELTRAVGDLRVWISETNGGLEAQEEFTRRYLFEPYTQLLRSDRILFYTISTEELFNPTSPDGMDYRFMAVEGRIPVLPSVLSLGIPRGAPHGRSARVFLRWFLSAEGQQAILQAGATGPGAETFGIAGGFSTLVTVNERALVRRYPTLLGHVPAPEYLRFPQPLPVRWPEISGALLAPWLLEAVGRPGSPDGGLAQELSRHLEEGIGQLPQERP